jgi:4-amino-4-deoxy-L-arabinose transferase-like glycosyltransferase
LLFEELRKSRVLCLIAATSFIFVSLTIFWNFQYMGLSHWDEYYFVGTAAWNLRVDWGFFQAYDPPLFPLLLSLMFRVFGFYDYVAVAASELMAMFVCALCFFWAKREFGFATAIVTVLILATTSLFILFAKMALSDMTFVFFFSAAIFGYLSALRRKNNWIFLGAGILLSCALAVKYNGFQPLLIILIFIPVLCLPTLAPKTSVRKRLGVYVRQVFGFLAGICVSLISVGLFSILFASYLGNPFPPMSQPFTALTTNFLERVVDGLAYFMVSVYQNKAGAFNLQFLVEAGFYSQVLMDFVGLPTVVFAMIGAVRGILKRNTTSVLLVIWGVVVFTFFSSLSGAWPRVILPLIVPLAILAAEGILSCSAALAYLLRAISLVSPSRRRLGVALQVFLILGVVLMNLYSAIPAITDQHSAYREAVDIISQFVPMGMWIWVKTQPLILVYLLDRGFTVTQGNMALLNLSRVIVLDFTAKSSPDYPKIQLRISKMTLAAQIPNHVLINMLDSTNFTELEKWEADPDRMNVQVYVGPPLLAGTPPSAPSFSVTQPVWVLVIAKQDQRRQAWTSN